jgi:hypothetical protein
MQEDNKMWPFKRGTSKVAIALLQVLLCSWGFVEQSCNVATPFYQLRHNVASNFDLFQQDVTSTCLGLTFFTGSS